LKNSNFKFEKSKFQFQIFEYNFSAVNDLKWKCCKHKSYRTHQDLQLLFWKTFHVTLFVQFKIWISKNRKFKQDFQTPNNVRWKSHEHKSCISQQDLQLLFWKTFHITLFEPFKIWISKNGKCKQDFQTPNDVRWKSHKHKSCISQQDLQLLFWKTFHVTLFEPFKKGKFKQHFETPNEFIWKSHEHESCTTHQDVQLLFWSFLHLRKW